jgi:hypothetical protein
MELYVFNPSIEQQGVIDAYSSVRWRRRFYEPGEFEIHVPATEENISLLSEGNIIHRIDRSEAGIIEGIAIESTDDNGDEITVTGRMGSSMLSQRIVTPTINVSGTVEAAMRQAVSDNAITARPITGLVLGTLNGFTETCSFQATYKKVLTVVKALSKAAPLGFRVRLDVPSKTWVFETYQGADRSVTQTELPYVLFSEEFQNISGAKYTLDDTSYCNFAYVGGEGEGSARKIVTVDQTSGDARRELWVDASDLQQGTMSDTDYQAQLTQRGIEKLAEAVKTESFEASAVNTENFEYLTDWDLGDIVSFEKWGLLLNQRITEVEEVYENGIVTVTPTCGSPLPETLSIGDDT